MPTRSQGTPRVPQICNVFVFYRYNAFNTFPPKDLFAAVLVWFAAVKGKDLVWGWPCACIYHFVYTACLKHALMSAPKQCWGCLAPCCWGIQLLTEPTTPPPRVAYDSPASTNPNPLPQAPTISTIPTPEPPGGTGWNSIWDLSSALSLLLTPSLSSFPCFQVSSPGPALLVYVHIKTLVHISVGPCLYIRSHMSHICTQHVYHSSLSVCMQCTHTTCVFVCAYEYSDMSMHMPISTSVCCIH